MRRLRLAILKNEVSDDHLLWLKACEEKSDIVDWEVVDITHADWLERVMDSPFDGLLASPPGWTTPFKVLYDERVTILNEICHIPIYPSLEEIYIYEDKKYFSYWLAANHIPHPKTWVFYYEDEALAFAKNASLPLVAKTNMGASGNGVQFLHTQQDVENYITNTFSGSGARRKAGPKWKRKGFAKRLLRGLLNPAQFKLKMSKYALTRAEVQKDLIILQEFIPHQFEWRCVRIGESYFAHKKLKYKDKASGSLRKGYEDPPHHLLDFIREITEKRNFLSQAVDIFVVDDDTYLVNEMQCIFGQSDPYQMLIDGKPGRYLYREGNWVFEEGEFNQLSCFRLRLEDFIKILKRKNEHTVFERT